MIQNLTNRIALVTGSTSGIGREIAKQLAERGAHVIVTGRNERRGTDTVDSITTAGGIAHFVPSTLDGETSARHLALQALEIGNGRVDILVNNAGIFPFGPTANTTQESFDTVYRVNVATPYFLVAALAPGMAERRNGSIVNITTMVAHYGEAGMSLYGSSKAALTLLTKAWAAEFGPAGVRVNAVSPGPTRTEGTDVMGDNLDQLAATIPARRVAHPTEIAAAVAFLASDDASFTHGAILAVDGGRTAS